MEEKEPNRQQLGHLRPTKLNLDRLPANSMNLEQMRAKDELIAKYDQQIAKLSHLRLKIRSKRQNWS